MAKALSEAAITTRNARSKLPIGLHWRGIDPEVHLGYRKGKRGGVWLVRWRNGTGYKQTPIGTADDEISEGTLDYAAADKAARATVRAAREEAKAIADGPPITVRSAVQAYIAIRNGRESRRNGREVGSDAKRRLGRYVLGTSADSKKNPVPAASIVDVDLHKLSEEHLREWRDGLPVSLKATSQQRLINDFRAALNEAYEANHKRLPATLPAVIKRGLKAEQVDEDEAVPVARDNQILTDAQIGTLLKTTREIDREDEWEGDLFRLICTLAATGARFSQVARMRVADVLRDDCRLIVPSSRKGKGKKVQSIRVPVGADVIEALVPAIVGRPKAAPLFERWRHKQVGPAEWIRESRGAWKTPSEIVRPWHAVRERAKMQHVIPYALRHSSIVRGIRANLPIRLVAALHDTSVAMIEKHYARWIVDGLDDLAAEAVVPLIPTADVNVITMAKARRSG